MRFCAQTFSASRRSPKHALCIFEVLEKVPVAPPERFSTVGCPPISSPWCKDAPAVDLHQDGASFSERGEHDVDH